MIEHDDTGENGRPDAGRQGETCVSKNAETRSRAIAGPRQKRLSAKAKERSVKMVKRLWGASLAVGTDIGFVWRKVRASLTPDLPREGDRATDIKWEAEEEIHESYSLWWGMFATCVSVVWVMYAWLSSQTILSSSSANLLIGDTFGLGFAKTVWVYVGVFLFIISSSWVVLLAACLLNSTFFPSCSRSRERLFSIKNAPVMLRLALSVFPLALTFLLVVTCVRYTKIASDLTAEPSSDVRSLMAVSVLLCIVGSLATYVLVRELSERTTVRRGWGTHGDMLNDAVGAEAKGKRPRLVAAAVAVAIGAVQVASALLLGLTAISATINLPNKPGEEERQGRVRIAGLVSEPYSELRGGPVLMRSVTVMASTRELPGAATNARATLHTLLRKLSNWWSSNQTLRVLGDECRLLLFRSGNLMRRGRFPDEMLSSDYEAASVFRQSETVSLKRSADGSYQFKDFALPYVEPAYFVNAVKCGTPPDVLLWWLLLYKSGVLEFRVSVSETWYLYVPTMWPGTCWRTAHTRKYITCLPLWPSHEDDMNKVLSELRTKLKRLVIGGSRTNGPWIDTVLCFSLLCDDEAFLHAYSALERKGMADAFVSLMVRLYSLPDPFRREQNWAGLKTYLAGDMTKSRALDACLSEGSNGFGEVRRLVLDAHRRLPDGSDAQEKALACLLSASVACIAKGGREDQEMMDVIRDILRKKPRSADVSEINPNFLDAFLRQSDQCKDDLRLLWGMPDDSFARYTLAWLNLDTYPARSEGRQHRVSESFVRQIALDGLRRTETSDVAALAILSWRLDDCYGHVRAILATSEHMLCKILCGVRASFDTCPSEFRDLFVLPPDTRKGHPWCVAESLAQYAAADNLALVKKWIDKARDAHVSLYRGLLRNRNVGVREWFRGYAMKVSDSVRLKILDAMKSRGKVADQWIVQQYLRSPSPVVFHAAAKAVCECGLKGLVPDVESGLGRLALTDEEVADIRDGIRKLQALDGTGPMNGRQTR